MQHFLSKGFWFFLFFLVNSKLILVNNLSVNDSWLLLDFNWWAIRCIKVNAHIVYLKPDLSGINLWLLWLNIDLFNSVLMHWKNVLQHFDGEITTGGKLFSVYSVAFLSSESHQPKLKKKLLRRKETEPVTIFTLSLSLSLINFFNILASPKQNYTLTIIIISLPQVSNIIKTAYRVVQINSIKYCIDQCLFFILRSLNPVYILQQEINIHHFIFLLI